MGVTARQMEEGSMFKFTGLHYSFEKPTDDPDWNVAAVALSTLSRGDKLTLLTKVPLVPGTLACTLTSSGAGGSITIRVKGWTYDMNLIEEDVTITVGAGTNIMAQTKHGYTWIESITVMKLSGGATENIQVGWICANVLGQTGAAVLLPVAATSREQFVVLVRANADSAYGISNDLVAFQPVNRLWFPVVGAAHRHYKFIFHPTIG